MWHVDPMEDVGDRHGVARRDEIAGRRAEPEVDLAGDRCVATTANYMTEACDPSPRCQASCLLALVRRVNDLGQGVVLKTVITLSHETSSAWARTLSLVSDAGWAPSRQSLENRHGR